MSFSLKQLFNKRTMPWYGLSLLAAIGYTAWFWIDYLYATPVETYHRAWQAAHDNYYDANAMGDWSSWEHKFDSQLHSTEDAVRCGNTMLKSLHDKYTRLLDAQTVAKQEIAEHGHYQGIGVAFENVQPKDGDPPRDENGPVLIVGVDGYPRIESVLPGGSAERAGIQAGDVILSIGGRETKILDMVELVKVFKAAGTKFVVTVEREGKKLDFEVAPGLVPVEVVTEKEIDDQIGYIRLGNFVDVDAAQKTKAALEKLKAKKSLILDLRKNIGGRTDLCLQVASLFMDAGTLVTIKNRIAADGYNTTTFDLKSDNIHVTSINSDKGTASEWQLERLPNIWHDKPLVVLIDKGTASSAEMLVGALSENDRATLFGTRTMGKGIAQTQVMLPNNIRLHITCAQYFTPKGHWLGDGGNSQSMGINADHVVENGKSAHDDPVLAAAVAWLHAH